jgi:hypothetical protein
VVDAIDVATPGFYDGAHIDMYPFQFLFGHQAFTDTLLVGHHNNPPEDLSQPGQGFQVAGEEMKF